MIKYNIIHRGVVLTFALHNKFYIKKHKKTETIKAISSWLRNIVWTSFCTNVKTYSLETFYGSFSYFCHYKSQTEKSLRKHANDCLVKCYQSKYHNNNNRKQKLWEIASSLFKPKAFMYVMLTRNREPETKIKYHVYIILNKATSLWLDYLLNYLNKRNQCISYIGNHTPGCILYSTVAIYDTQFKANTTNRMYIMKNLD